MRRMPGSKLRGEGEHTVPAHAEGNSTVSDTTLVKALEVTPPVSPAQRPARREGALSDHDRRLSASLTSRNGEGLSGGLQADRSESSDLRAQLRALEEQLRLRDVALNSTSTHFLIVASSPRGPEIVYLNRAACADHGYTLEELLGRSPAVLTPPELNPDADRSIREAIESGTSIRLHLRARRKDGAVFDSGITITPIHDSSGMKHYSVSVGANITAALAEHEAKKRLQEQLVAELQERERMGMELRLAQKLESVGRLAAGIAHEINTPIQFVGDGVYFLKSAVADLQQLIEVYRGAVDSLAHGVDPGPVQLRLREVEAKFDTTFLHIEIPAAFERTRDGIERVAAIVRAMKEFAHPDAKEQSPADINHAIETTLLVARNEYKYCAEVQTELAELPPLVCNVGELNQVFLNLIVNAAHAIEAAGRDVSTGLIRVRTALAGKSVEIVFEDNGCGIPQENLERVFDPFFTTKEVGKGTGQGLALARSIIVEKHGGRIDVDSEVGRGTRMILRLPIGRRASGGKS